MFQPMCWLTRVMALVLQRRNRLRVQREVAEGDTPRRRKVHILL